MKDTAKLIAAHAASTGAMALNRAQKRAAKHSKPDRQRTGSPVSVFGVVQACAPYTDEPIPGLALTGASECANFADALVTQAFESLKCGVVWAGDEEPFDLLAHALGVSCIRAAQIAGESVETNEMLPPLIAGNKALRSLLARRRKWGKWELLPAEVEALDWAVEIYQTILHASSPAQMTTAVTLRLQALKGQMLETVGEA